jgi:NADH-quinone oxidoreductase subunit F
VKSGFLPKDYQGPRYLCCNADERTRHVQGPPAHRTRSPSDLEGILLACYAIGAESACIIYAENSSWGQILEAAIAEARTAGYIEQTSWARITANVGYTEAPAPISVEKKRRYWNRSRAARAAARQAALPATHGLYNKPTVVNNVETLANLPHIISRGPEWFASIGSPPKSTGTRIFCVSGHVKRPGNYEVPMGVTFRELIYEQAGGMRSNKPLKASFQVGRQRHSSRRTTSTSNSTLSPLPPPAPCSAPAGLP